MNVSTTSLYGSKKSAATLESGLTKNRYQQFIFSKQFDRAELAKIFEQKVPSPLVTALNAIKVAPAVFFALEKLAAALETLKNDQNSHKDPLANAPKDDIPREEGYCEIGVSEAKKDRPVRAIALHSVQDDREGLILQSQSEPKFTKPDGARYNSALPPAPSNRLPNLLIGSGITTVSLGVAYVAASYFNILPDSLNIFRNITNTSSRYRWVLDQSDDRCYAKPCTNPEDCVNDLDCIDGDEDLPDNHRWVLDKSDDRCYAKPCTNSEDCVNDLDCIDGDEDLPDNHRWVLDKSDNLCYEEPCTNPEDCESDPECNFKLVNSSEKECAAVHCTDPKDCLDNLECKRQWVLLSDNETCKMVPCHVNSEDCVNDAAC